MADGRNLTEGSIVKNLIVLSLPMMFSNLIQVVYNLTDTYWLGQLASGSTEAVAVTGIAFPLVFLFASLGQGIAVATTALISRFKGANEPEKIRMYLGQVGLLLTVFMLIFFAIALFFIKPVLLLLNTPETILESSQIYIRLIMFGMGLMFVFFGFQSFAMGIGDGMSPMVINLISVIVNLVLDPIMIYGWIGCPAMGLEGAALATLISRAFSVILSFYVMKRYFASYIPSFAMLRPDYLKIKEILRIGIPASLAQTTTSLGFVVMQGLVNKFGTEIISANSIGFRFVNFIMMPPMGMSNALSSIIGQCLGAGKKDRAIRSFHVSLVLVMIIMTIGSSLLYFHGDSLSAVFINDPLVVGYANEMLKINSIAVWIFGFLFMFWGVFNGSGYTKPVMIVDLVRLWIVRIPMAFLLSGYLVAAIPWQTGTIHSLLVWCASILGDKSYTSIWWPMIFSNFISTTVAFWIYRKGYWLYAIQPESNSSQASN